MKPAPTPKPAPKASSIRLFVARALAGVESLPIAVQADLHAIAAEILRPVSPECAAASSSVAAALRLADEHQLYLFKVLNPPAEVLTTA